MIATEKVYEVQSYLVKFDLGPVDVNINVYHENQTELTREEILQEAFGYADDAGIKLHEQELFEIETLEFKESKKPQMITLCDYEGEFEVEVEWLKGALERLEWGTVEDFADNYVYDDAQTIRDNYLEDIAGLHLDCGSCHSEDVRAKGYGFKKGDGLFIRVTCNKCGYTGDCGDGEFFTKDN